ncbi:hypothetical protein IWQ50_006170 [Labrenzia sp. EL_132]|nr:hypothetical protein [Labrenzia sp. EL_132]MBG6211552.1 hypothetical protein [Labrenzia sp. EL_126]
MLHKKRADKFVQCGEATPQCVEGLGGVTVHVSVSFRCDEKGDKA